MNGSEAAAIFGEIVDDVVKNQVTAKIALELQAQYGVLTEDDLKKVFTI